MKLKIKFFLILLFTTIYLSAQSILISGVVVDEGGVPLPGVTVLVEGTSNGTSTTFEGTYALKVDSSSQNFNSLTLDLKLKLSKLEIKPRLMLS